MAIMTIIKTKRARALMLMRNMAIFINASLKAKNNSRSEYIQKDDIRVMRSMGWQQSCTTRLCIYKLLQQNVYTHAEQSCGHLVNFYINVN